MDGSGNPFNDIQNNRQAETDGSTQDHQGSRRPNGWNNGYPYTPYQTIPHNRFAVASMILGLISLLTLCTYVFSIPLGALGILFALLSRRSTQRFASPARTGIITSILGIIIGIFCTVSALTVVIDQYRNSDPASRQSMEQQLQSILERYLNEYQNSPY